MLSCNFVTTNLTLFSVLSEKQRSGEKDKTGRSRRSQYFSGLSSPTSYRREKLTQVGQRKGKIVPIPTAGYQSPLLLLFAADSALRYVQERRGVNMGKV
jgi:hypothetical protein